jgi:hypothetical protein
MVSNPKVGDRVYIRYKKSLKDWFPLEGKIGTVAIVCKQRRRPLVGAPIEGCKATGPVNHGVMVDRQLYVIPCGNLFFAERRPAVMAQPSLFDMAA